MNQDDLGYQIYSKKEIKKMSKERGIFTNPKEESFKSDKKIKREAILRGDMPYLETPLPEKKEWPYWSERFIKRQEQYREVVYNKERHVEITIPEHSLLSFIGDGHPGHPWTFHERIKAEIDLILNTPNSYIFLGGDMIDGYFFNPAQFEQIEQAPEQVAYMKSMIEALGQEGKLLVAWSGDHDGWSKKMGIDPYAEFANEVKSYFMHGVGFITLKNGDNITRITAAHQLPGHSIYNKAHPAIRASREIQGADWYVNFHTHKKAHLEQGVDLFGGDARWVHALSCGPYKASDEYSRKKGWMHQNPKEMFGFSFILDGEDNAYCRDIVKAHKKFTS